MSAPTISFVGFSSLDAPATNIAGSTGIALSGADVNNLYQLNVAGLKYFTLVPTAYTQGVITAKLLLIEE